MRNNTPSRQHTVLAVVATILLCVILTGCGGGKESQTPPYNVAGTNWEAENRAGAYRIYFSPDGSFSMGKGIGKWVQDGNTIKVTGTGPGTRRRGPADFSESFTLDGDRLIRHDGWFGTELLCNDFIHYKCTPGATPDHAPDCSHP